MTTVLRFPESARDEVPEREWIARRFELREAWHDGLGIGYGSVVQSLRDGKSPPDYIARARESHLAVAAHSFEAWAASATGERAIYAGAYDSGILAAWADHPEAEQCVNCDLPFVPGIEDGWRRCQDHGPVCSDLCRAETCRVPSCREDEDRD